MKREKGPAPRDARAVSPARIIAVSFAIVIALGTLLLLLPACTAPGKRTTFLDALFTATSASCVTGLVTVDTGTHWSTAGQLVIMLLLQIGGLGLVTFTTFFHVMIGRRLGLRSRLLAQESVNGTGLENITLLVRMVVTASLLFELTGALILSTVFVPKYGMRGVFLAVFLSVSAFCNGGMDPLGFEEPFISLCGYSSAPVVLAVIMALIIVGGLGFVVWSELAEYRLRHKLSLHTRVVLIGSTALILLGALLILLLEHDNPATLGPMSWGDKLLNALFGSVTCRTAGFNTFDLAGMRGGTKVLFCVLMFIGACPGSTGGGIKVTTFAVVMMTVWCVVRGNSETVILRRRVTQEAVYKALAILVISLLAVALCSGTIMLVMEDYHLPASGLDVFFEAVSAFGTVGLSSGVTAAANIPARVVLIFVMYLGRVGPVSFALALATRPVRDRNVVLPEGRIAVG